MIARLALAEAGIDHDQVFVDIHVRGRQQTPDYVRLNPNMTVPTLVLPGKVLDQSREILAFAFGGAGQAFDGGTAHWIGVHYAYPIEELTFGGFLARHALARAIIPARMAATRRRLLRLAAVNPDLAGVYQARAAVFQQRERTFDPKLATGLLAARQAEAIGLLDRLEHHFAGGRTVMIPPGYGAADVVWTVFLARIEFAGMGRDITARPALNEYWRAMQSRPSFAAADIWTRLHIGRLILGILRG